MRQLQNQLLWAEEKHKALVLRYFGRKSEKGKEENSKQYRLFNEAEAYAQAAGEKKGETIVIASHERKRPCCGKERAEIGEEPRERAGDHSRGLFCPYKAEACKVAGKGGLGKEAIGIIGELYGIEGDLREAVRSGRIDADTLSSLLEIAKIQSAGASNRIEGIYAADKRLRELVKEKIPLPETEASRKSPAKACFYFPLCR